MWERFDGGKKVGRGRAGKVTPPAVFADRFPFFPTTHHHQGDTYLQYSTDGGTTWTITSDDPENTWLDYAVGGRSGEVVVAILITSDVDAPAYFSVNLSLDQGETWTDVDISSVLKDTTELTNAVVSATGRTIAISTNDGIIASKDQGATWQNVPVSEDAWTLAGVEDGTGGLIANLFAWDTNGHLCVVVVEEEVWGGEGVRRWPAVNVFTPPSPYPGGRRTAPAPRWTTQPSFLGRTTPLNARRRKLPPRWRPRRRKRRRS